MQHLAGPEIDQPVQAFIVVLGAGTSCQCEQHRSIRSARANGHEAALRIGQGRAEYRTVGKARDRHQRVDDLALAAAGACAAIASSSTSGSAIASPAGST